MLRVWRPRSKPTFSPAQVSGERYVYKFSTDPQSLFITNANAGAGAESRCGTPLTPQLAAAAGMVPGGYHHHHYHQHQYMGYPCHQYHHQSSSAATIMPPPSPSSAQYGYRDEQQMYPFHHQHQQRSSSSSSSYLNHACCEQCSGASWVRHQSWSTSHHYKAPCDYAVQHKLQQQQSFDDGAPHYSGTQQHFAFGADAASASPRHSSGGTPLHRAKSCSSGDGGGTPSSSFAG